MKLANVLALSCIFKCTGTVAFSLSYLTAWWMQVLFLLLLSALFLVFYISWGKCLLNYFGSSPSIHSYLCLWVYSGLLMSLKTAVFCIWKQRWWEWTKTLSWKILNRSLKLSGTTNSSFHITYSSLTAQLGIICIMYYKLLLSDCILVEIQMHTRWLISSDMLFPQWRVIVYSTVSDLCPLWQMRTKHTAIICTAWRFE